MPTLEYIRIFKDKKLLLLDISEQGERSRYTVSEPFYISIGSPCVGQAFSESEFDLIKSEDTRIGAMKKALSILSYADNSEAELAVKLVKKGYSKEVSSLAAKEMVRLGYIDEERQLRRHVLREANINLAGYSKFLPKLLSRGYSRERIKAVTAALISEGEIDFRKNALRLIEKKLPKDADGIQKKTLLYKNGYKI